MYVAVQLVPEGVEPLEALRADLAERRGIQIVQCGEGYRRNDGPRSALGRARAEAERVVEEHDAQQAKILAARRGWESRRRRALAEITAGVQAAEIAL